MPTYSSAGLCCIIHKLLIGWWFVAYTIGSLTSICKNICDVNSCKYHKSVSSHVFVM